MSAVTESTLELDLLICHQPQQQKIKSGMYITIGPISMMRWVDDIYIYPFPYLSIHLVIYHTIWVCSHRNKTRFLKETFTRGLILCEACWNLRKIKISNAFACSSCWVIKAGEGTGHNEHVSNWDIDHSTMVDPTNTPFRSTSFILSNRSQISSKARENKDMAHEPAWVKREKKKTLGFPWAIKQTTSKFFRPRMWCMIRDHFHLLCFYWQCVLTNKGREKEMEGIAVTTVIR